MIATFSYPLPDELYVEGVSGELVGTYTYNGPETFDVHITSFGTIKDIDVHNDPDLGSNYRKTINASINPEVAYFFNHYFIEDYQYVHEYEEEIMENGDVYQRPINPNLTDAYELKYDFTIDDWSIEQIVKDQTNPSSLEAQRRKEYVENFSSKYSFGSEIDSIIDSYLTELNTFIEKNPPVKTWKYTNISFNSVPKIPHVLAIEFAKIPTEGV